MAGTWRQGVGTYDPYGTSQANATKATGEGRAQKTPGTSGIQGWRGKSVWDPAAANAAASGTGTAPPLKGGQAYGGGAAGAGAAPASPFGSESGPGILENWFNQRATGTDPAFEYASKRGMESLGNRYGAAGLANSGAARQGESDLMANLIAQRMGQLDNLAGGASGEHQGRLNSMFGQGLGIAGGQAGLSSAYDLGAAGNMQAAQQAQMQLALNKAGVDQKAMQGLISNGMSAYAMSQGMPPPRGGGGGGY